MAKPVRFPIILIVLALLAMPFAAYHAIAQSPLIPSVDITSPTAGSTLMVGEAITINASSTDPAGVSRLEMWLNNQLTGQAGAPPGQVLPLQMDLMLRWVPSTPGSYTLQARSINGDNLSPISVPVVITVLPGGSPTPAPVGCTPMITVRARALNIRSGPGTTYSVIGRMQMDQTAEVTGRNSTDTWWRVRFGTVQGWISASYVAATCVNSVPIVDQPTPAPTSTPAADIKFWADSTNINAGQCTTIRWEVDNVQAVYLNEGGADQGVIGHGSKQVCPASTTTYKLIVILTNGQRIERELTINAQGSGASINFRADHAKITYGDCTVLRWDVENAKAVYISDGQQEDGVSAHGSAQICPKDTTTYRLRAVRWDNQNEYREVKIKVQKGPGTLNFWADRTDINKGECTTLRWQVTDAKAIYLNLGQGEQQVNPSGSIQVCPPDTSTYFMRVEWLDGQQSNENITITVHQDQPQPIVEFSANPQQIVTGDSSVLAWKTQNVSEIYLDGEQVEAEGTREIRPEQDTTYTLGVIGLDGSKTEYQVTVRILLAIITPTINITANPTDITQGECSTLNWDASHGQEFYINGEPVDQSGSRQVCPAQTTDYTFRVVTLGTMDAYRTARINVGPIPQPTEEPMPMPTVEPLPQPTEEDKPMPPTQEVSPTEEPAPTETMLPPTPVPEPEIQPVPQEPQPEPAQPEPQPQVEPTLTPTPMPIELPQEELADTQNEE